MRTASWRKSAAAALLGLGRAGRYAKMPIMSGTVRDEQNFAAAIAEYYSQPRHAFTAEEVQDYVRTAYPATWRPRCSRNTG